MSTNSPVLELLSVGGPRLPLLLVYLVGIILSLTTWGRHPTASLLSLLAFVLFVLSSLLSIASFWYVMHGAVGLDFSERTLWMAVTNYVAMGMHVIGWVLLLFALFARRPQVPALWGPSAAERVGRDFPEPGAAPGPSSQDIRS